MANYIYILTLLIFFSVKISAQWYQQNSGTTTNLTSIYFIDANTGWTCGSNGIILKTTNKGFDWFEQSSNTTAGLRDIQFVDQDNGWVYGNNIILNSTDGGATWNTQYFPPQSYIIALQYVNLNTGWLVHKNTDTSFISKTNNGGITWSVQFHALNEYFGALYFLDLNYGWVASAPNEKIFRTIDGGINWVQHNGNVSGGPMCIKFVNQMTGWASSNSLGSYEISKTADGGVNWSQQIWDSFKFINCISVTNSNICYAAGWQMFVPPNQNEGFILNTTDGGANWDEQYRDEGVLNSIFFVNDSLGWAVGNSGKILATESVTYVMEEDNLTNPKDFNLSQNFPNPFNPTTKIEFRITDFGFVTLKVYDLLGREIATLINEEKPAGVYEVEFSATGGATGLPSGIYFYQLKAGPSIGSGQVYIETKKMVFLK